MKRKRSLAKEDVGMSEESDFDSDNDPETPITEPQTPIADGRKILPCPYQGCAKSFNRQARLTEHIRSHTNERPFTCPEKNCDKAFLRDSHLKHHIKSAHTNERDYSCTWANCGKKFATGTRLRRHESSHQTKEKYTCKGFDGCNETFRKHATLSRHILAVHENKKPFPCTEVDAESGEQCYLGFDTAEKLRSHKRAIHDYTRFVCMDCPPLDDDLATQVSFATYALLQAHIAEIHPPTCPQCCLLCSSEKDLRRHLELIHNVVDSDVDMPIDPAFPCTYPNCARSFTKRGNLNVHVKTVHEHRKDFVCGQTELKLPHERLPNQASKLATASEITGCGRHFTSKATLEEHVRTVHLGLSSKRQERNRKRKAEKAAYDDYEGAGSSTKTKRRRKAPQPTSAIAELTGSANLAFAAAYEADPGVGNPFDALAYGTAYNYGVQQGFDHFPVGSVPEEEKRSESSWSLNLDNLATSALVDPVLL